MAARLPTPLVLILSGTMLVIGAIAFLGGRGEPGDAADDPSEEPRDTRPAPPVDVRDDTPEAVAETFLDAWRKRDYRVAMALSVGRAAAQVEGRRRRESAMSPEQRRVAESLWNQMAESRLTLEIQDRSQPDPSTLRIAAIARGTFLNQDYANRVLFEMRRDERGWKVATMDFPNAEDPFSAEALADENP